MMSYTTSKTKNQTVAVPVPSALATPQCNYQAGPAERDRLQEIAGPKS